MDARWDAFKICPKHDARHANGEARVRVIRVACGGDYSVVISNSSKQG